MPGIRTPELLLYVINLFFLVAESGFFGCAGSYTSPDHFPSKHPVFVKMCKQKESDQFKELFFMEATILGQFNHPNVLQLHGVSLKS